MNLRDIEERVVALDTTSGRPAFIYELLEAYGFPRSAIARLRKGMTNHAKSADECLWRSRVYDRYISNDEDIHLAIDRVSNDAVIAKSKPRFLIVRNEGRLVAIDTRTEETLDIAISELPDKMDFFLPWANIEKTQLERLNYADVKAAEKMARLYDEILKQNEITSEQEFHHLNIFFSRLLFCFFAEDTGVFAKGLFTDTIASYTNALGDDVGDFLDQLFLVLNTGLQERNKTPERFQGFGYVNGNLFKDDSPAPRFSAKARRIILECGTLDWSRINPDIFGSMIQAVVHPNQRESLGMHYTSVENIMKVLRPLFLDELYGALDEAKGSVRKLKTLLFRISTIKVFDPACGSGNFLVLAYKELRKIEHKALQSIIETAPHERGFLEISRIKLEHFSGIEIDDFAHEIAILSLWLAKHQMNIEFRELFGIDLHLIPLKDTGNIVCGNATRISWTGIFQPTDGDEIYIVGNPPYLGSRNQNSEQKADLRLHHTRYKSLDYVCSWFIQSADLLSRGLVTGAGLVATNSITQGDQVGILWPDILAKGVEISFAHQSFKWSNEAKGKAGVICVVIGLGIPPVKSKRLYSDGAVSIARNINPYLVDGPNSVVVRSSRPLSAVLPTMTYGCLLNDGGHLILTTAEREDLLNAYPTASKFIKPFFRGGDFLAGDRQWCLHVEDSEVAHAIEVPEIRKRFERVTQHRLRSSEPSTRKLADFPNRYYFSCYRAGTAIAVPAVSSERRAYIPMGYVSSGTIVSNKVFVIYGSEPWLFGLLQSRMHMAWMRAVGGRMKSDYSYSNTLVYNTFPVPDLGDSERYGLQRAAMGVIEAREQFAGESLATLYDPDKMPTALRRAHDHLDAIVDAMYNPAATYTDEQRLAMLFKLYEESRGDQREPA